MHLRACIFALSVITLGGCSSGTNGTTGDDGGTGGGGGGGGSGGPTCALRTAMLAGSVDGMSVEQSYSSQGYALVTTSFTGYIGTRGRVEVTLASAGVRSDGTGNPITAAKLTLPSESALSGKVICATGGSLRSGDGGGYAFTLTGLQIAEGDAGAACTGRPVAGEIQGCVAGSR